MRSLLGLDVKIVESPDHECTAVHFTDCLTLGNGFYFGGNYYLICDPSFVGASIGKCMPEYRSVAPQVYVVDNTKRASDHRSKSRLRIDNIVNVPEVSFNLSSL